MDLLPPDTPPLPVIYGNPACFLAVAASQLSSAFPGMLYIISGSTSNKEMRKFDGDCTQRLEFSPNLCCISDRIPMNGVSLSFLITPIAADVR